MPCTQQTTVIYVAIGQGAKRHMWDIPDVSNYRKQLSCLGLGNGWVEVSYAQGRATRAEWGPWQRSHGSAGIAEACWAAGAGTSEGHSLAGTGTTVLARCGACIQLNPVFTWSRWDQSCVFENESLTEFGSFMDLFFPSFPQQLVPFFWQRLLLFPLGKSPSSVHVDGLPVTWPQHPCSGRRAHETSFDTCAKMLRDRWPVKMGLLMALPYRSCIWVLSYIPRVTLILGSPRTWLSFLLLQALPGILPSKSFLT